MKGSQEDLGLKGIGVVSVSSLQKRNAKHIFMLFFLPFFLINSEPLSRLLVVFVGSGPLLVGGEVIGWIAVCALFYLLEGVTLNIMTVLDVFWSTMSECCVGCSCLTWGKHDVLGFPGGKKPSKITQMFIEQL